ncbi:MAG: polyprenyl synthetase family protein [Lachnospiraceae bacterium]|nr:polyprenyl synthetase family protein [Lachnospiraceae bacterium]
MVIWMISEINKNFPEVFEECMKEFVPQAGLDTPVIDEAVSYSLFGGGKRLRPMLMAVSYEAFSGRPWEENRVLRAFMTALEMIHTYSLIHDDLPAMDDDDMRRGKRTNHIVFGEDIAILAGDALLNGAFEVMSGALLTADPDEARRGVRALAYIAGCSGVRGMVGGQAIDISGYAWKENRLIDMYEKKTGCLLAAAMTAGSVLAGASQEDVGRMEKCAFKTGVAFQVQDDLLDVTGDAEVIGKPVGSDEKRDQVTFVTLRGIEGAEKYADECLDEAMKCLEDISGDPVVLKKIIASLSGRRK